MTVTQVNIDMMIVKYRWATVSFNFNFTKEIISCQPPTFPVQCKDS